MIAAALGIAAVWPVFPINPSTKAPLTPHGWHDASQDPDTVRAWWQRSPHALVAIPTGATTRIVALDIDVSDSINGWDALEELGVSFSPETPMSHTPRGGTHCLFTHPGHFVKTIAGKLGRGLDIRGDGGSLILPPGPGRSWDPHLNLETVVFAPMPSWMSIREQVEASVVRERPCFAGNLSRYAEAALDSAVKRIIEAPAGEQEITLNSEAYAIGQLAGAAVIPPGLALEALIWAASRMPSFDRRRPWREYDLERKANTAFTHGLRIPRGVPDARY